MVRFAPPAGVSGWVVNGMIGMMQNRAGSARCMRAAGVAIGALALLLAGASARAGEGEPEKSLQERILESIGIKSGQTIDYRERSPLVVPPKLDLPPPEEAQVEKKSPAWPVDAAVKQRQLQEAKRKKAATDAATSSPAVDASGKPVDEDKFREFGKMFGLNQQETATFVAEPPRTTLVEPPPGYRTPSPAQPYGIGAKKAAQDKPRSLEDRTAVPR
jgi:hypothetical protein